MIESNSQSTLSLPNNQTNKKKKKKQSTLSLPFCYSYLGAAAEIVKLAVDGFALAETLAASSLLLRLRKQTPVSSSASASASASASVFVFIRHLSR